MKLIDPIAFFGVDSGQRQVMVNQREAATLRSAATIVERAHELVIQELGDGHYDLADVDLCLAIPTLRGLANGTVEW